MTAAPVLPSGTHVGQVTLQVADLDRSLAFYQHVVGFHLIDRAINGGVHSARLGIAPASSCLLELREKPGARHVPPRGLIGLYHFAILLPDRADLGRFIVHAINRGTRIAAAEHLFSEALYLTDPDGLQVEIYRDRPRTEWTYRDGQVVSDTLPLDFDPVIASAVGTTWKGLPPGTAIGHVHLYVRDLQQAHDFYVTALGFTPTITSFPGALFVAAGGYHHHVGLNTWAGDAPQATDDDARLLAWDLGLPDAAQRDAAVARLAAAGHPVMTTADGLVARDPWDLAVRLTAGR